MLKEEVVGRGASKMRSVRTTEYHSAVKSKEMPTQATPQMDREDTVFGEVGQTRKDDHCRIPRRVDGGGGRVARGWQRGTSWTEGSDSPRGS